MITKNDRGKPKLSLVPPEIQKGIAYVRDYGAAKYKNEDGTPNHDNWKEVDPPERWLDACLRHLTAYAWGENRDPESGLSHLAHAACSLAYLMERESGTNRRVASPPRETAGMGEGEARRKHEEADVQFDVTGYSDAEATPVRTKREPDDSVV
jgi:hypothetical protein